MTGYCLVPHVNLTDANEQVANIVLSLLSNGWTSAADESLPTTNFTVDQYLRLLQVSIRPVATRRIRVRCPPNVLRPIFCCDQKKSFKHTMKTKILTHKMYFVPQTLKPGYVPSFRGATRGRSQNSPGDELPWGRQITTGAPKSSNNVTSISSNIVHLLPKDLSLEHGCAKLASCPRRHLTSFRPCLASINTWLLSHGFSYKLSKEIANSYLSTNNLAPTEHC